MTHRTHVALVLLVAALSSACDATPVGESSCTDGVDNDMNGRVDCEDAACAGTAACGGSDGGAGDGGSGACGPESCMGCCDGDRCVSGASLAACGQGGAACEVCALGASCEADGCVGGPVACGPANCDGCCMGDICVAGDRPAACGAGGGACDPCDAWEVCSTGGCGVDGASRWQVELLGATIPATNFDGSDWDGIGAGEADPFVALRVGSAGATPIALRTIDDTLTPDWTDGGTVRTFSPRVTAAEILAFLRFDMFDEDVTFNDTIGMCRYDEGTTPFNGEIVTLVCAPDAVLGHAGFTLRWRLVPG